jgi:tRNA dimethylallyltransferase
MLPLYAIVGPTGTGKSELAMSIAEEIDGEIVSVDSAQVFRGLDIGTAKPTEEERERVRHHLIDVIEPSEQWSAAEYAKQADRAIADVRERDKVPILCGGTGLWLRALVHGIFQVPDIDPDIRARVRKEIAERGAEAMHAELRTVDPDAALRIMPGDPQRIGRALEVYRQLAVPISKLQAEHGFREVRYRLIALGIEWPREELAARLAERTRSMYARGLIDEAARMLQRGISADSPGLSIIGYRDATRHVLGELTREEAIERTTVATRQYAKRQRNWFRSVTDMEWVRRGESTARSLAMLRGRFAAL